MHSRLILSLAVLGGLCGPAFAQSAGFDWTGFYAGVLGGAGASPQTFVLFDPEDGNSGSSDGSHTSAGIVGGAFAGNNWQQGPWLFGVEGSLALANVNGTNVRLIYPPDELNSEINAVATLMARAGFPSDDLLLYGKAGGAVIHELVTLFDPDLSSIYASGSGLLAGIAVGGGVELALTDQMTIGVDVTHIFIPTQRIDITCIECANEDLAYDKSGSLTLVTGRAAFHF